MSDLPAATAAVTELVSRYSVTRDEMADLLTGTVDGGPNGNGYYPVTAADGNTKILVPSPRRLAQLAGGMAEIVSGGSLIAAVGDRSYEKYATLGANLGVAQGAWGVVYDDTDTTKNGFWVKIGAPGAGYWTLKIPLISTEPGLLASPSVDTSLAIFAVADSDGNQLPVLRNDGRILQTMPDGTVEPAMSHGVFYGDDVPLLALIDGERPWRVRLDASDNVIEAWTYEGSYFLAVDGTLARSNDTGPQSTVPMLPLIGGEVAIWVELGDQDHIVRALTADGGYWVAGPDGLVQISAPAPAAVAAPMIAQLGGERVRFALVDVDDFIYEAWTEDGGHWIASADGLVRTNRAPVEPTTYTQIPFYNGGPVPIAVPDDPAHGFIFASLGQSGPEGTNSLGDADPIVAATPVFPGNALMFSGGVRRNVFGRDDNAIDRVLVPLVEAAPYPTLRETSVSGWVNHFLRDLAAAQGPSLLIDPSPVSRYASDGVAKALPKVLGFVCALGSKPYEALKRGSTTWRNLCKAMDDAVAALRAAGCTKFTTVFEWDQGNTNLYMPGCNEAVITAQLKQLYRHLCALAMERTGEIELPIMLVTQQGEVPTSLIDGDPFSVPTVIAQARIDGHLNIRSADPVYWLPHAGDPHYTCLGHNYHGQALARRTIAELFGTGSRGFRPLRAWWTSSTTIKVEYDLPVQNDTLVLDLSGTWIATAGLANSGYVFNDGSAASPGIQSLTVAGRILTIVLTAAPTGPRKRLRYALDRNAGTVMNGPTTGARGCLRGAAGSVNLYNGVTVYDWALMHTIDL